MSILKRLYHLLFPLPLRRWIFLHITLRFIDKEKYEYYKQWRGKKVSLGNENPDKTFYVIRIKEAATGLLSCYLSILGNLKKIHRKNYYAIVDMKSVSYELIGNPDDLEKGINSWNHYFHDLCEYDIDVISKSKKVIYSSGIDGSYNQVFFDNTKVDNAFIDEWSFYSKKYIKLNENLLERFNKKEADLFKNKRVLGTMVREGYMVLAKARKENDESYKKHPGIGGHPKQLEVDALIEELDKKMVEWNCDYLFLVCETNYIEQQFKEHFGDKLITSGRTRLMINDFTHDEYVRAVLERNKVIKVVDSNKDYLEDIYLLSRCTSLISSKCSGSIVASLWNDKRYEKLEVFQEGVY